MPPKPLAPSKKVASTSSATGASHTATQPRTAAAKSPTAPVIFSTKKSSTSAIGISRSSESESSATAAPQATKKANELRQRTLAKKTESIRPTTKATSSKSMMKPRTAIAVSQEFPPRTEPVIRLPFEASRIGASVENLQRARMWPSDPTKQQLLIAIIQTTNDLNMDAVLTVPSALALAGCCIRLAGYLLRLAMASGSIGCGTKLLKIFYAAHRTARQQFQKSGWAATSLLPKTILDHWWQIAAANPPDKDNMPPSLDCESEKAMCGAIITYWLNVLTSKMYKESLQVWESSPLLTLMMLDFGMCHHYDEHGVRPNPVVELYDHLNCSPITDLDVLQLFEPLKKQDADGEDSDEEDFTIDSEDKSARLMDMDYVAIVRILDTTSSWYHKPEIMRIVAEQFIRGQRQSHSSDEQLRKLKIRPRRIRGILPQGVICPTSYAEKGSLRVELHISVTDAANREWPLVLELSDKHGLGTLTYEPPDSPVQTVMYARSRSKALVEVHTWPGQGGKFVGKAAGTRLPEFAPHLSPSQQTALDLWKKAQARCQNHFAEVGRTSNQTPGLDLSAESSDTSINLDQPKTYQFGALRNENGIPGVNPNQTLLSWIDHEFEQITFQALPLLDFEKWGMSRYDEFHTEELRHRFQICILDAASTVNGLPLLPTVLLDIVAGYYTLEALPYITPEEQKQMSDRIHTDNSKSQQLPDFNP